MVCHGGKGGKELTGDVGFVDGLGGDGECGWIGLKEEGVVGGFREVVSVVGGNGDEIRGEGEEVFFVVRVGKEEAVCGDGVQVTEILPLCISLLNDVGLFGEGGESTDLGKAAVDVCRASGARRYEERIPS